MAIVTQLAGSLLSLAGAACLASCGYRWKLSCSEAQNLLQGGGVDEMQNKAKAQPAWLQLTAGALAGAWLSLAIMEICNLIDIKCHLLNCIYDISIKIYYLGINLIITNTRLISIVSKPIKIRVVVFFFFFQTH